jgi:hypothetical protein
MIYTRVNDRPRRRAIYDIGDQLSRVSRALRHLDAHCIAPLSVSLTTLSALPTISVEPHPRLYSMFAGRIERHGYRQDGARRYEVYEALDRLAQVRICWQEVVWGM